ncbi:permease [Streptomyces sp. enrichment culture]|uniref:permease n=1 Tax=Streptomyces sp. enrichment culture TaxID=1795815 RepID=UPI003F567CE9
MSDQKYAERRGGLGDAVRLGSRAGVYVLLGGFSLLAITTVVGVLGPMLALDLYTPPVAAWWTVFTAVVVQGVPFLLLGACVSAAVGVLVPERVFTRLLPRRQVLAVPVAGAAGAVLPGCECASVPVAGSLMRRGVAPAAALAFLLSAPAINPVVLVATSLAFPGRPMMVVARLVASLGTAVVMGWLWARFGREEWLRPPAKAPAGTGASRVSAFAASVQHDFLHAGGFLVLGSAAAATFNVTVPRSVLDAFTASAWVSVLLLALLAVVLCVCSEADAFVAASLSGFGPVAQLVFMVVGPMVDLKLFALQAGTFGREFAVRFSSATWVAAVAVSVLVGWWVL